MFINFLLQKSFIIYVYWKPNAIDKTEMWTNVMLSTLSTIQYNIYPRISSQSQYALEWTQNQSGETWWNEGLYARSRHMDRAIAIWCLYTQVQYSSWYMDYTQPMLVGWDSLRGGVSYPVLVRLFHVFEVLPSMAQSTIRCCLSVYLSTGLKVKRKRENYILLSY